MRWMTQQGMFDHDLEFDGLRMVYKQWFDPGKDPNRYEASVPEFLAGALHDELRVAFGQEFLDEIVKTVDRLTTGGPGVAEPSD